MPRITIRCPNCRVTRDVPSVADGREVRCKRCGTPFVARHTVEAGKKSDTKRSGPPSAGDPFPTLPVEFGRYRVTRLLGKGGMGAVYLAEDSQLRRKVALKLPFFDPSETARADRFVREARSAAGLHHPHICTVFDAGTHAGRPFISMAYIEGEPLDEVIDPDRPMPERRAAEIARKVALALAEAHENGVVHRDLKPANVMLTAKGEPVVMDFGLAKRAATTDAPADSVSPDSADGRLTQDGAVMGTPHYMPPEQVRGELARIGPPADVYSLGAMLFELLTGRTPYTGPPAVVMAQVISAPVPPVREFRPGADPRLDAICRRAMAKEPADRFRSMTAMVDALNEYLAPPQTAVVSVDVIELPASDPSFQSIPMPSSPSYQSIPVPPADPSAAFAAFVEDDQPPAQRPRKRRAILLPLAVGLAWAGLIGFLVWYAARGR